MASITTLTVLSLERFLIISRPFTGARMNHRTSLIAIIAVWVYALILTTPPLAGWGGFTIEGPGISCSVDWATQSFNNTSYIIFLFVFGLGIPVILMAFSYTQIVLTMRQSRNGRVRKGAAKAEIRVALMVSAMWVTFLVAWTPYAVVSLFMVAGGPRTLPPEVTAVPAIVAKSSCIYNPIIYVGLNTQVLNSAKSTKESLSLGARKYPCPAKGLNERVSAEVDVENQVLAVSTMDVYHLPPLKRSHHSNEGDAPTPIRRSHSQILCSPTGTSRPPFIRRHSVGLGIHRPQLMFAHFLEENNRHRGISSSLSICKCPSTEV